MNPHLSVLTVDDDFLCRAIVPRMLRKIGIGTDMASNGQEAVSALEEQPYDIVLMDIQMPEMNGIEAAKIICRRWPGRPKIIFISDCAPNIYKNVCLDLGAIEFLAKPVNLIDLCMAISRSMAEMQGALMMTPAANAGNKRAEEMA